MHYKNSGINNNNGFSWIGLTIAIAIIGILAAIAIPNYIAYREKSFCSATELDAHNIRKAIEAYFSDPKNVTVSESALKGANSSDRIYVSSLGSSKNPWEVTPQGNPARAYEIIVTDASSRCPEDYKLAMQKS